MRTLGIERLLTLSLFQKTNLAIGLNLALFLACGVTEMDPPDKVYLDNYLNESDNNIKLTLENSKTQVVNTIEIPIGQEVSLLSNSGFNGGEKPIQNYVDDLVKTGNTVIKLYVNENLRAEWTIPFGNLDEGINSPFNYNSWKLELFEPPLSEDIVGKIVFTITDEDVGN